MCHSGDPDIFQWLLSVWMFCFCTHRNTSTKLSVLETEAARFDWSRHFSSWVSQRAPPGWPPQWYMSALLITYCSIQIKMQAAFFKNLVWNICNGSSFNVYIIKKNFALSVGCLKICICENSQAFIIRTVFLPKAVVLHIESQSSYDVLIEWMTLSGKIKASTLPCQTSLASESAVR